MDVHDLTAAYALDALDAEEREAYEHHLAQCERCRDELAQLGESATALAYAVESPPPPPALRARILEATANNVVALPRRRWQAIAAVAACVAIGLGVWAGVEHNSLSHRQSLQIVDLHGKHGMLIRSSSGDAVLIVDHLPAAPEGMTYEAWVIPPAGKPRRAGSFDGGDAMTIVKLTERAPRGSTVAATMEKDGGVDSPTEKPFVTAQL